MKKIYTHIFAAGLLLCSPALAQAQNYHESFEDWDGVTPDWLPEGWSEIHTDDVMPTRNNGEYTWHVINPDNSKTLPKASDGNYYAAIGYAKDENNKDISQDEWLISPAFKLSQYGGTMNYDVAFAPLFLFRVDNGFINWNEMDFIGERQSSADLQIYVLKLQDDGTYGDYWDMYVSLFADWCTQPLSSLMSAEFSNTRFHTSQSTVFLTDDDMKDATVRIAFRYVGQYGNIIGIDKFRMGYATLVDDAPSITGVELKKIANSSNAPTIVHNLSGRVTPSSATNNHGINIVTHPDGTSRKVLF